MKFSKRVFDEMKKCPFCEGEKMNITKIEPDQNKARAIITLCYGCYGSGMAYEDTRGGEVKIEWYKWPL